jgi:hypothetical protein
VRAPVDESQVQREEKKDATNETDPMPAGDFDDGDHVRKLPTKRRYPLPYKEMTRNKQ